MKGIFVIGTDTGVGKTMVCAGILKMLQGTTIKPSYWKPVQTGTIHGDDTTEVKTISGLADSYFMEPAFRFPEPLSPFSAASKWGKTIELKHLVTLVQQRTQQGDFVIIEGAGGLLVPYHQDWNQLDFIKAVGFPILIVGRDNVGVINQSLLTIESAKRADIPILGVVLTHSTGHSGNSDLITQFSGVKVLLEIMPKADHNMLAAEVSRCEALKQSFGLNHKTV